MPSCASALSICPSSNQHICLFGGHTQHCLELALALFSEIAPVSLGISWGAVKPRSAMFKSHLICLSAKLLESLSKKAKSGPFL